MTKKLRKLMLFLTFLFTISIWGQNKEITGTVFDPDGVPIPGVSVVEKGTQNGISTDFDGNYSIQLSTDDNPVLVFSSIGYVTNEIPVKNQNSISVELKLDVTGLDEVVVVGYGTQKKKNLTGAVATIDSEVLDSRPITDVARGLQGVSPGLTITTPSGQIGQDPVIRLRGSVGSLGTGGGAQPLILVDNVEVPSLQAVNPEDVKDISVLKDAASTSIYGARGAWGVILITTKNGNRERAPTISYSNNFSWATPTNTPTVAPAAEGAEMAFSAVNRREPSLDSYPFLGMAVDQTAIQKMREWEELYGDQDLGMEMVEGRDYEIRNGQLFFYRSWDPQELFVKKWALQQKHDVTVSGGSEHTNYYLGLGYLNQGGVYQTNPDKYERYNINLSINTTVTDWMDINAKVLNTNSLTTEPFNFGSSRYDAWYYTTRWPAYYPYGTVDGKPFRNHISEVEQAKMNENNYSLSRFNIGTVLKPAKDLSINFNYTHDREEEHEHQTGGTLYAYNFWAQGADFSYVPYSSPSYNRVQYNSEWSRRNTAKLFANYSTSFDEKHEFNFTAGGDLEEYEDWFQYSQRRDLLNPDQGELNLATGDQFVGGDRDKWTTLGFFARANYSYKNKILLEVNARYDGSSRLSSDKKWGYFPSFSAGYVITEEKFMESLKPTLSFFKFRGSYGSIGNQNTYLSNIYRLMSPDSSGWLIDEENQVSVSTPGPIPSSLTWETVTTLDFGFDAKFFNDKLGIIFDWYQRKVSDMHSPGVTLPNTFGTFSPTRNYGEMQTTGWELAVNFRHQFKNGLNINATATVSDFKEEITKYANTTKGIYSYYEGKQLGEIWGYETDRFFTEGDFNADGTYADGVPSQSLYETNGWFQYGPGDIKYKDLNGDGVIDYGSATTGDTGDMKVIGNSTPRYQYGFQFGADWKGFDFSFFMQGVGKRDFWANGSVFIPGYRWAEGWYEHQLDYWTPDNPNAYYPRPNDQQQSNGSMNFLPQSKYLLDLSYLRMKNLTFGYTLPQSWSSKVGLERFRVYFSGENLFEFTGAQIPVDPEVDYTTAGINDTSTYGRVYPYRRSLSFGLQLTF
ncbi:TonB-dependent receptor [Galbibacter sp. BG1]|uniref:SusC/RagA family TonB-linked outer membrane protein n=1 Tax=Galbibacter sp. BG1 TaxID=1170699 RepID=UPI0015B92F05|nr:TonB-dependent receptor [Galbibacter sp. BG1]QLE00301.1 TonB-dependent receptor [Galbibacter sp. BG1]